MVIGLAGFSQSLSIIIRHYAAAMLIIVISITIIFFISVNIVTIAVGMSCMQHALPAL